MVVVGCDGGDGVVIVIGGLACSIDKVMKCQIQVLESVRETWT